MSRRLTYGPAMSFDDLPTSGSGAYGLGASQTRIEQPRETSRGDFERDPSRTGAMQLVAKLPAGGGYVWVYNDQGELLVWRINDYPEGRRGEIVYGGEPVDPAEEMRAAREAAMSPEEEFQEDRAARGVIARAGGRDSAAVERARSNLNAITRDRARRDLAAVNQRNRSGSRGGGWAA